MYAGAEATMDRPDLPATVRPRLSRLRFRGGFLVALLAAAALAGITAPLARQGLGGGGGGGSEDGGGRAKPIQRILVSLETASRTPIANYLTASSTVEAERKVDIIARVEGFIERVHVQEGAAAQTGDVLAEIDENAARLALHKAELNLETLERVLRRTEELRKQKLVHDKDYDEARLKRDVAAAERAQAALTLRDTRVVAPFVGRITLRAAEVGQSVKPGATLFTIMDTDPLITWVHLPSRDAGAIATGDVVALTTEGREPLRLAGRVALVAPVIDAQTGTVRVRINLIDPPADLKPGAYLKVEILRETKNDALVVPKKALVYDGGSAFVFRAVGRKVEKIAVVLGLEDQGRVEVLNGLGEGDQVVTVGKEGLRDGSAIETAG